MSDTGRFKRSANLITRPLLAGAMAMSAIPAIDAQAAIYMKITASGNFDGEVTVKGHEKEIALNSFSDGLSAVVSASGGGGGAGKPSCGPIEVTKMLDKASPPLMAALFKGTTLNKVVISFSATRKDTLVDYYVVTLTDAQLSAFTQDSGGDRPSESLEMIPRQIDVSYKVQDEKGTLGSPITAHIDCVNNKAT